jgi:hypothetical protein
MTMSKQPTSWTLIAIFALFALPSILATLWYFARFPVHTQVHATLLHPPQPIITQVLHRAPIEIRAPKYKGKWTLVYLTNQHCGYHCQGIEHLMMRLIRAQGENSHRLQSQTFIIQKALMPKTMRARKHPTYYLSLASLIAKFPHHFSQLKTRQGLLFLVDPQGLIMGYYSNPNQADAIFTDLKKILKVSQVG